MEKKSKNRTLVDTTCHCLSLFSFSAKTEACPLTMLRNEYNDTCAIPMHDCFEENAAQKVDTKYPFILFSAQTMTCMLTMLRNKHSVACV